MPVRNRTAAACLVAVLFLATAAAEQVNKLQPEGYVNDFAGVLSARTSSDLYQLCQQLEEKAGAQIAIVTIHKLEGLEASDFANRLFAKWGVGHKDNRGILILLAVDDHKYWVEVGYGLEPILNDAKVGDFGREMVPYLKRGDYNGGVQLLTERIAGVIAKDRGVGLPASALPQPARQPRSQDGSWVAPLVVFFILAIIFGPFIAAILTFLFTGKWPRSGRTGAGWGSGGWSGGGSSWGGFGGGSGGFGGFGGGMSGGGGAGGSW